MSQTPHGVRTLQDVLLELVWVARALTNAKNASAPTPGRFTFRPTSRKAGLPS